MKTASTINEDLFRCPQRGCSRSYRRKEHLIRHSASHGQAPACECPFCDKVFSRTDTLRQHVRAQHKNKELKSSRTVIACSHCRSRKTRCDGRTPCEACLRRGLKCSLPQLTLSRQGIPKNTRTLRVDSSTSELQDEQYDPEKRSTAEVRMKCTLPWKEPDVLHYVEVYFEKFHPAWPFLHRATFEPSQEPPILLQSVVMMGLWMSGDEEIQCHAIKLHDKLSSLVYEQRDKWAVANSESEVQSSWPMATYQSILLQIVFACLRDTHSHVDIRLALTIPTSCSRLLTTLTDTCLRKNMFFYPAILDQFSRDSVPDVFVWVGIEEVKRFALALYKVGRSCHIQCENGPRNSLHSANRRRSLLSLADLQFALPDSDELWHATSDLAARLAKDRPLYYDNNNAEANWISQSARLLQRHDMTFDWL
ncbi:C2H2 type zinc finger domain protein [Aspergillus udagawae]|uniref:C2H2 type zinc finger domain protein n=1 Tax=Aspergillus udagawae TaxID=91492 RepID=A0ABQ1A1A5_9EURO|nr:C2H2 type zinc finger domain protein [Aspergillus udagawae]GFG22127.1 C2H2 type zinc finger domain protein [Aspergillus udagawae]